MGCKDLDAKFARTLLVVGGGLWCGWWVVGGVVGGGVGPQKPRCAVRLFTHSPNSLPCWRCIRILDLRPHRTALHPPPSPTINACTINACMRNGLLTRTRFPVAARAPSLPPFVTCCTHGIHAWYPCMVWHTPLSRADFNPEHGEAFDDGCILDLGLILTNFSIALLHLTHPAPHMPARATLFLVSMFIAC